MLTNQLSIEVEVQSGVDSPSDFSLNRAEKFGAAIAEFMPQGREAVLVVADELIGAPDDYIADDTLFLGAVLPYRLYGLKTIMHPLPSPVAFRPEGWLEVFADDVAEVVLRGYSAFTLEDALLAGQELLSDDDGGRVRTKPGNGTSGHRQAVVSNLDELTKEIELIDQDELATSGLALEENVEGDVSTLSIGTVSVGDIQVSYFGIQKTATDCAGSLTYGGSDLWVRQGGFDALLDETVDLSSRTAIEQAMVVDSAFLRNVPQAEVTRRNYDVLQLINETGLVSGVLEQSYRVGGATGAEIEAAKYFTQNPDELWVRASTDVNYHNETPAAKQPSSVYELDLDPHTPKGYRLGTAYARPLTAVESNKVKK